MSRNQFSQVNVTATTVATAQLIIGSSDEYQPSIVVNQDGVAAVVQLIASETQPVGTEKSFATLSVNATDPQTVAWAEGELPVFPANMNVYAYLSTGASAVVLAGARAH